MVCRILMFMWPCGPSFVGPRRHALPGGRTAARREVENRRIPPPGVEVQNQAVDVHRIFEPEPKTQGKAWNMAMAMDVGKSTTRSVCIRVNMCVYVYISYIQRRGSLGTTSLRGALCASTVKLFLSCLLLAFLTRRLRGYNPGRLS